MKTYETQKTKNPDGENFLFKQVLKCTCCLLIVYDLSSIVYVQLQFISLYCYYSFICIISIHFFVLELI